MNRRRIRYRFTRSVRRHVIRSQVCFFYFGRHDLRSRARFVRIMFVFVFVHVLLRRTRNRKRFLFLCFSFLFFIAINVSDESGLLNSSRVSLPAIRLKVLCRKQKFAFQFATFQT